MTGIALLLYLALFYLLPAGNTFLYEWVWRRAPSDLPYLVVTRHGAIVWNGAFYVEMLGAWLAIVGLARFFEWVTQRDDPEWGGLSTGAQRRSGLLAIDMALLFLFPGLVLCCLVTGHPVHGPLSAGFAVFSTLFPAAVPRKRDQPQPQAASASPNASPASSAAQTAPADLPMHARSLTADEPPGVNSDLLQQKHHKIIGHLTPNRIISRPERTL